MQEEILKINERMLKKVALFFYIMLNPTKKAPMFIAFCTTGFVFCVFHLSLTREVDFAKRKTEGKISNLFVILQFFSPSVSFHSTASSSEVAENI